MEMTGVLYKETRNDSYTKYLGETEGEREREGGMEREGRKGGDIKKEERERWGEGG